MPPAVLPIGNQGFPDLLNRLGIQPPLVAPFWYLSNVIQPVSLVDQEVDITTIASPVLFGGLPSSAGFINNPAANAILADTGQLPAGNYDLKVWVSLYSDTTGNGAMVLERRDAANAANIWSAEIMACAAGASSFQNIERTLSVPLQENERFRIRNVVALAGTATVQATIFQERRP